MEVIGEKKPWGMDEKQFIMLMHFAQLAGYVVWGLGFALPIIMWVTQKEEYPEIDKHGKKILNWMISLFIYLVISGILSFVLIGLIPLFVLGIVGFIYPIVGGIQANDGKLFDYPITINLIK